MKRFLMVIFALALTLTVVFLGDLTTTANAATEGYYTYTVSGDRATIVTCDPSIRGDVIIPDTLGGYPVTVIGEGAFYNCVSLTEVNLPEGVTNIKRGAFSFCSALKKINIPKSVVEIGESAFGSCTNLVEIHIADIRSWLEIPFNGEYMNPASANTKQKKIYIDGKAVSSLEIPDGVTRIGDRAFSGFSNLTSISIPDSVTSIGFLAFFKCTKLTSITIPDSVKSIDSWAFSDCTGLKSVTIGSGVESIGDNAFCRCTALTSVTIGNGVESVGQYAFYECAKLKSLIIGSGVKSIGGGSFYGCTGLKDVYVKDPSNWCKVTFGDEYAYPTYYTAEMHFADGNGDEVTTIVLDSSVTKIPDAAFKNCKNLAGITIPDSVTRIGNEAFLDCTGLTGLTIGSGVKTIGERAFGNCGGLLSVTIPNSVTTLSSHAFWGCTGMTNVTIGNGVKTVGNDAFRDCYLLASLTVGSGVKTIGDSAFEGDFNLRNVYYAGSQSQWKKISIGSDNGYLISATKHYKHVHDYTVVKPMVVAPRCLAKGYTKYTCVHGEILYGDYVPALGHDFSGEVVVSFEPHCDRVGWMGVSCTRCDTVRNDTEIPKTGHKLIPMEEIAPTCEKAGRKGGKECFDCEKVFEEPTVIPALGHNYTKKVVAVTYTKQGYTQYTCGNCGHSYKDSYVKAKGLLTPSVKIASDAMTGRPTISWGAIAEANSYGIYRATSKTGKYTKLATITKTSYTDTSGTVGTTYYYKVVAVCKSDSKLNSKDSNIVSATIKCGQPTIKVTQNSKKQPVISWGKVNGAKKYDIYYATSKNGTYKKLTYTTKTSYTHSKASGGKEYFYKVCAYNSTASKGAFSSVASTVVKLATPSLTVTAENGQATLKWKEITGATAYELQCSTNGGEYKTIATVKGTSYTHKGLAGGNKYTYRLRAVSSVKDAAGAFSAVKTVVVKCAAPAITVSLSKNQPVIKWGEVSGAVKYQVYYATSKSGKYKLLGTVTGTSYTHKGAPAAKACYYKVVAVDKNGNQGEYSSVKNISTKCLAPTTVKVTRNAKKQPVITWSKVSGAKKYEVYVATSKNGTYKKLTSTNKLTYTYTKAKTGTTYYFKITAYGSSTATRSAYSVVVKTP